MRSPESAKYGAVISFVGGRMQPLPFDSMINPETGRMRARLVDITSETYECARRYMIRLDERDFCDPEKLAAIAKTANLSPEQFRERFGYLVSRER